MQNIFLKSSQMSSLMRDNGVVFGWLPSDGNSPFSERLWQAVLAEAASGGEIKVSSRVIEVTLAVAPSDCLFSRKRRRELCDALESLILVIPGGENMLIQSILSYHEESLKNNSGICRLGKYHDILHVAAHLAEKYQVQNSDLVSQLLNDMFRCENSFDRLVAPAILGPKVSHILSSWRSDIENESRALSILSYFANHANASRLKFRMKGETIKRRLLDVPMLSLQETPPVTVAVQANEIEALRLLLQNGADPGLYGLFCPMRAATQKLSSYARSILGQKPSCDCSEGTRRLMHEKDWRTFKKHTDEPTPTMNKDEWTDILYATSFSWDPSFTMCTCERNTDILWPEDNIKVLHLIETCIAKKKVFYNPEFFHPKLFTDGLVSCSPPTLKAFSRLVIRRALNDNWNLPLGINKLNLPITLISYLNLEDE